MLIFNKKFIPILFFILFFISPLAAQSLMLLNDSPFKLDVIVINALGDTKGNLTMAPQQQLIWKDDSPYQRSNSPTVPYTVIWYCQDGSEYGIWINATSGSMVTAQGSSGQKMCRIKKPKKGETNTNIND
ncbi:MAG: hypothetical protein EBU93_00150 [Chlamydiae bacterium]|nr:hypothetical protein [Chlamydiota bacterium]